MQRKVKTSNIKTVAELANVSISTVSRVMNNSANVSDELKDKVFKAINQTGYSINPIASTLKSTRRNQIAIIVPSLKQIYYTDIIRGASNFCLEKGATPILLESVGNPDNEKRFIKVLTNQWIDGIIFIPSMNYTIDGYKQFIESLTELRKQERNIPVVLVESAGLSNKLDSIRIDYSETFYKMTYHLMEIGRKRLAFLSNPVYSPLYDICLEAFHKAAKTSGKDLENEVVEACTGYTILSGYTAMKKVQKQYPDIDGVVCCNDQIAAGALIACRESGIALSEQIAIIGYGGVAVSIITSPSITTMVAPRYELGYESARVLYERINGERKEAAEVLLHTHLAIRPSTLRSSQKNLDVMFSE